MVSERFLVKIAAAGVLVCTGLEATEVALPHGVPDKLYSGLVFAGVATILRRPVFPSMESVFIGLWPSG
jgi:hypothetical protein